MYASVYIYIMRICMCVYAQSVYMHVFMAVCVHVCLREMAEDESEGMLY